MKINLKRTLIIILAPLLVILVGFGIYYVSYNMVINSKINKIEEENNQFYELLNEKNIRF